MSETLLIESPPSPPKKLADPARFVASKPATLLDLLDRLLDAGVAINGRVLISIADIDLIYLNLKLLLSSVETVREKEVYEPLPIAGGAPKFDIGTDLREEKKEIGPGVTSHEQIPKPEARSPKPWGPQWFDKVEQSQSGEMRSTKKLKLDPQRVQHDMAKLLLTVAELLRRLMERQAIKRVDGGSLNARQIEQLGQGLMALEKTMGDLKQTFGLRDEELNLDLGPMGELM